MTMTTVGYGDTTPNTDGGKVVTTLAMLFGVLFISMPLAIVGNNFCLVWDDKERVIFVEKLTEQLERAGRAGNSRLGARRKRRAPRRASGEAPARSSSLRASSAPVEAGVEGRRVA